MPRVGSVLIALAALVIGAMLGAFWRYPRVIEIAPIKVNDLIGAVIAAFVAAALGLWTANRLNKHSDEKKRRDDGLARYYEVGRALIEAENIIVSVIAEDEAQRFPVFARRADSAATTEANALLARRAVRIADAVGVLRFAEALFELGTSVLPPKDRALLDEWRLRYKEIEPYTEHGQLGDTSAILTDVRDLRIWLFSQLASLWK